MGSPSPLAGCLLGAHCSETTPLGKKAQAHASSGPVTALRPVLMGPSRAQVTGCQRSLHGKGSEGQRSTPAPFEFWKSIRGAEAQGTMHRLLRSCRGEQAWVAQPLQQGQGGSSAPPPL